mmetsp:Transcript_1988/g.2587  ORF Transcript_1988/g.2587 Transcript_1988/m.2587 type:complete len:828 (+) Transcript_1988:95-2578(+)
MSEQEQPESGQPDERIIELNSAPINVDDIESLRKELSTIQELIKDQNEDWKVRMAALQRFQRLMDLEQIIAQFKDVEYGQTNFEPTQNNLLNAGNIVHLLKECNIPQALITQVEDRRSNLCKEACKTVTSLAKTFRSGFNFYVDELAPALLKLLIITIKVIADSAHSCIESFVTFTYPTILQHIQNSSTQNHPALKARCAEYLLEILEDKQIDSQKLEPFLPIVEETLRRQLGDSAPATRATSRKSFIAFKARWESRADSMFESLDPTLQKSLSTVDKTVKAKATTAPKRTNFRAFLKNQTQNQDEDASSSPETSARSDSSSSNENNNNNSSSDSTSEQPPSNTSAPTQNTSLEMNSANAGSVLPSPSKRKMESDSTHIIQDVMHPSPDHSSSTQVEDTSKHLPINRELNFEPRESKEQPEVLSLEVAPSTQPSVEPISPIEPAAVAQDAISAPVVESALVQTPEPIQELSLSQPESSPALPESSPSLPEQPMQLEQPAEKPEQLPAPQSAPQRPLADEVQPHKKRAVAPSKVVAKAPVVAKVSTRAAPTVPAVTSRRTVAALPTASSSAKAVVTPRVTSVGSGVAVKSQPVTSARLATKPVSAISKTTASNVTKKIIAPKPKAPDATTIVEPAPSEMGGVAVAMKVKENIPPATSTKPASLTSTKATTKASTSSSSRILQPVNGVRPVDITVKKTKTEPVVKLRVIPKPKPEVAAAPAVPAPKATSTTTATTTSKTATKTAPAPAPVAPVRKLSHRLKKSSPTAVRIMNSDKSKLQVVPSNSSEIAAKKAVTKSEGTIAATSVRQFPVRTKPLVLSPRSAAKTKAK